MATIELSDGSVALVTGAAGGIGLATARRFAEAGAGLALVDITDRVREAESELAAEFGPDRVRSFLADVTDEAAVIRLAEDVEGAFGRLDHLATVAGVNQPASPIEKLDVVEWQRVHSVNVLGPFILSKHFVPLLRRDGGGTITTVASFWGRAGRAFFAAYCSSKAAVFSLTQSLADELAPDIRVNAVAPGNINTSMHTKALEVEAAARGISFQEMKDIEWDKIPLRVAGDPSTIADAIVFLSSPAASYITGASLDVNGGVLFH